MPLSTKISRGVGDLWPIFAGKAINRLLQTLSINKAINRLLQTFFEKGEIWDFIFLFATRQFKTHLTVNI